MRCKISSPFARIAAVVLPKVESEISGGEKISGRRRPWAILVAEAARRRKIKPAHSFLSPK